MLILLSVLRDIRHRVKKVKIMLGPDTQPSCKINFPPPRESVSGDRETLD